MNENVFGTPNEPAPDFAWPFHIAEALSEWLNAQWETFLDFGEGLLERPFPHFLIKLFLWSCVAYAGLAWVCLCYIRFPISPYGLWDIVKWAGVVIVVTLGAIYTMYMGGLTIALFLSLFLSITICFTLSLGYICWVLLGAVLKRSSWLKRYRSVVITGLVASLALATFVDGSYRFWDRPFEIVSWTKLVLISASAWAGPLLLPRSQQGYGARISSCRGEVDGWPNDWRWYRRISGSERSEG